MPFPEKFRNLIELNEKQVRIPDYVWLSYAVCATEGDSCGWQGWIIESAWQKGVEGADDADVEADTEQGCPVWGRLVYRTEVEKQFQLNPNAGPKITYPYETAPITFVKSRPHVKGKKRARENPKK